MKIDANAICGMPRMTRRELDGRLALRLREVAEVETDSGALSAKEKARILNIAADTLEEYILREQSHD